MGSTMRGTRVLRCMGEAAMTTPIWHETGTTTTAGRPRRRDPSDLPGNGAGHRN